MPHRLTKIYTRRGDDGSTQLGAGPRVRKDDPRLQLLGALDELSAALGALRCELDEPALDAWVREQQQRLFDLGGEVALPAATTLRETDVTALETRIDAWNRDLPPLREFVLPGPPRAAACAHLARTVARRAERDWVLCASDHALRPTGLAWLNRLSDALFVLARHLTHAARLPEPQWTHRD